MKAKWIGLLLLIVVALGISRKGNSFALFHSL